jgi:chemotaxis protein CheD
MDNNEDDLPEVYLQPGDFYLARRPAVLKTLLGSCVGVTFWSPRLRIGALCHGILPRCPPGLDENEGFRYVDFAIRELVNRLEGCGASRVAIQIKVFGGADVLPVGSMNSQKMTVGSQNWRMALEVIENEGMKVIASDLGGTAGRTIHFNTGTGEVFLRRLVPMVA